MAGGAIIFASQTLADEKCVSFIGTPAFNETKAQAAEGKFGGVGETIRREFVGLSCTDDEIVAIMTAMDYELNAVLDYSSQSLREYNGIDYNKTISFCMPSTFWQSFFQKCQGFTSFLILGKSTVAIRSYAQI
ncbi:MAG: hypothetical protein V3V13_08515 [Paracoccaceae bacterium]